MIAGRSAPDGRWGPAYVCQPTDCGEAGIGPNGCHLDSCAAPVVNRATGAGGLPSHSPDGRRLVSAVNPDYRRDGGRQEETILFS